MLLSHIIQTLLFNQGISYSLVSAISTHQGNNSNPVKVSVNFLKDPLGTVMAIYLHGHQFNLSTLKALIDRPELRFMSTEELEETLILMKNMKSSNLIENNPLQLIIDEPVSNQDSVLFVSDDPYEHIQVDIWDMQIKIENALIGGVFSHTDNNEPLPVNLNSQLFEQLKKINHLPVMPSIAAQLLALHGNSKATVNDMVRIISHDPVLTAQVLRYANSAMFGFSGQIASLQDAIFRVLGYKTVLYMAFGAALGRAFQLPQSGRLSMSAFWKQATHRAALCQQLALRMPAQSRPEISVVYITGLLHNIGIVLMGTLFKTEFEWLNKMLTSRPEQSLIFTELNLFGCTHSNISRFMLNHWNMPGEITLVAAEHHTSDYKGDHANYVWLTQLAGQALQPYGLSDSDDKIISVDLCQQLELSVDDVEKALQTVLEESDVLDAIADTLCA